ncbi:uncharacterized protein LOC122816825 isoform X2 [Protopterus annectens]|uniref:uncharacterized protein LOC122816825 isoform X2 n=1 Tax=Protopterus annectens TaxID=7888 RepID=UPI001CFA06F7|nr:uncharacterized protein LOC122816825 isoform X2 [Protopterus annectens]
MNVDGLKQNHVAVICAAVILFVFASTAVFFLCYFRIHSGEHHTDGSNEISAADFAEPEENENVESIKYVELDLSRKPTEKKCVLLDNSCEYDYPAASVMPSSHGRHITYAELAQPTKHKGRKVQSKTAVHDDAQHL